MQYLIKILSLALICTATTGAAKQSERREKHRFFIEPHESVLPVVARQPDWPLNKGIQVDAAPRQGWTSLMAASTFGRVDIVKLLLAAGADANVKLPDGATPLYQASANGNKEVVEALVAAASGLDAKTRDGRTALMRAAWMGHTAIVKILIAAGADVKPKDKDGWSAFRLLRLTPITKV